MQVDAKNQVSKMERGRAGKAGLGLRTAPILRTRNRCLGFVRVPTLRSTRIYRTSHVIVDMSALDGAVAESGARVKGLN